MPTTQPPLIVTIDGAPKVSVSNTVDTPVPVQLTKGSLEVSNTKGGSLAVSNPNLVGPPGALGSKPGGGNLWVKIIDIPRSGIVVTPISTHGSWISVIDPDNGSREGWINIDTVTGPVCAFWYRS